VFSDLFSLSRHLEGDEPREHLVIESLPFGMILAVVGGYLDAYTYIGRGGVFCNAQTGNLVLLGIACAKGDWPVASSYLPPILAFVLGVLAAELIKKRGSRLLEDGWPYLTLSFEMAVLIAIGFIPGDRAVRVVTLAASFAASLQVSSFGKLVDSGYSTTMCTGNLRSAAQAAYAGFSKKDRAAIKRATRYLLVILSFMVGAGGGSLATLGLGEAAIWIAAAILAGAVLFLAAAKPREAATSLAARPARPPACPGTSPRPARWR